jgi:hypothetical protein
MCDPRLKNLIFRATIKGETSVQFSPNKSKKNQIISLLRSLRYSVVDRGDKLVIGWENNA